MTLNSMHSFIKGDHDIYLTLNHNAYVNYLKALNSSSVYANNNFPSKGKQFSVNL